MIYMYMFTLWYTLIRHAYKGCSNHIIFLKHFFLYLICFSQTNYVVILLRHIFIYFPESKVFLDFIWMYFDCMVCFQWYIYVYIPSDMKDTFKNVVLTTFYFSKKNSSYKLFYSNKPRKYLVKRNTWTLRNLNMFN